MSPYHNSTQEPGYTVTPPTLEYTVDGYLATVTRGMVTKACSGGCGKSVTVPMYRGKGEVYCRECRKVEVRCSKCGEVFRVSPSRVRKGVTSCSRCGGETGEGKRGKVVTFSWRSANRLGREVSRLKLNTRMSFVTLTFPDAFPYHTEPEQWKRHLKMFENRFRRAFPKGSYVWKMEVVDRKSGSRVGELSPHFHLLVTGVSNTRLKAWVPGVWYEIAGYGDENHLKVHQGEKAVETVRSQKAVRQYASKKCSGVISAELSKQVQSQNQGESVGRWWGIIARHIFEHLKSAIHTLAGDAFSEKHALILLRYFRRMARLGSRAYYRLNCFIDGKWLGKNLTRLLEPIGKDRFKVTGRTYETPFWKWAYELGKLEP